MKKRNYIKQLANDFLVIYESPGGLIQSFEVLGNYDELNDLIVDGKLRVSLKTALERGYEYYTYAPKSACSHYSLYRVKARTCRQCEHKKRTSPEFLEKRKLQERTSEESKRRNRDYNRTLKGKTKTKRWREKSDANGNQIGLELTRRANQRYHSNPHNAVLIRQIKRKYANSPRGKRRRMEHEERCILNTPAWYDPIQLQRLIKERDSKPNQHLDHYIPIAALSHRGTDAIRVACGLHCADNLRIVLESENLSKGPLLPAELSNEYTRADIEELTLLAKRAGLTARGDLPPKEVDRQIFLKQKNKARKILVNETATNSV